MNKMLMILPIFMMIFSSGLSAQEDRYEHSDDDSTYVLKTQDGLTFRVPEDMPIEKRDGVVAPMPFNEYIFLKIKQINKDLSDVKDRLSALEKRANQKEMKKNLQA